MSMGFIYKCKFLALPCQSLPSAGAPGPRRPLTGRDWFGGDSKGRQDRLGHWQNNHKRSQIVNRDPGWERWWCLVRRKMTVQNVPNQGNFCMEAIWGKLLLPIRHYFLFHILMTSPASEPSSESREKMTGLMRFEGWLRCQSTCWFGFVETGKHTRAQTHTSRDGERDCWIFIFFPCTVWDIKVV